MCPVCNDLGYYRLDVPVYDERFGRMIRCQCRQLADARHWQQLHGSPMMGVTLVDVMVRGEQSSEMKQVAGEFINQRQGYLTIWGTNGNGKSTTLQSIANECMAAGIAALYVTAFDLMEYVKDGFDKDVSADDRIRQLGEIPVLCVDELLGFEWSKYDSKMLGVLLDRRYAYRHELGTVVAMDKNPRKHLENRISSRLASGRVVYIEETDMRPLLGGNHGI